MAVELKLINNAPGLAEVARQIALERRALQLRLCYAVLDQDVVTDEMRTLAEELRGNEKSDRTREGIDGGAGGRG